VNLAHRTAQRLAGLLLALAAASTCHAAPATNQVYYFTADCTDCAAAAHTASYAVSGQLTVDGNTKPGDAIGITNFVSFVYQQTNLQHAFSVTVGGSDSDPLTDDYKLEGVSGNLPASLPGASGLALDFSGFGFFYVQGNGNFVLCAILSGCPLLTISDYGTQGSFSSSPSTPSTVPEPSSFALVGLALLTLGAHRGRVQLRLSALAANSGSAPPQVGRHITC
jgi:hypothetical protein